MDIKYYLVILFAVTVVIGSIAGTYVSAEDNASIKEITKTISIETLTQQLEAKGFEVTLEDENKLAARHCCLRCRCKERIVSSTIREAQSPIKY